MNALSRFCCLNPKCPDYGWRDAGNLSVCMRYGAKKQTGLLYCRTCKVRFSERKGTPLFGSQLSSAMVISILEHLVEGCGVRKTARLAGVNQNTVIRYSKLAGGHAKALHDELVAFSHENPRGSTR